MRVVAEQGLTVQERCLIFSESDFLRHPDFRAALQASARDLIAIYDLFPRVARHVASHQKWTLSQAAFALHFERDRSRPDTGITTARLLKMMHDTGGASRNTAAAFIAELVAHKLMRDVEDHKGNRKLRPYEPTEITYDAMLRWFLSQMSTLDRLDNRGRREQVEADLSIFERAQPLATRLLLSDPDWSNPPDGVAIFVWTECGGLLLDDLMARPKDLSPADGKVWLDANLASLASHYMISNTHIRRLFTRAQNSGFIGKAENGRRGRYWLSARLIDSYCRWQAIKLATLANTFEHATHGALRFTGL